MTLDIGPYTLSKRTEYSKIQVFDKNNNNITNTEIVKKIITD